MQNFPLDPKKADQDHDDKYNQVMKGMFLQISQSLLSMLKNLKYIYEAHGILYRIDHLHSVMLNMLMPPQLVSFLHFWCPDQTFREEAFKVLEPFKHWQINSKKIEIKKAQPKQNFLPLQVEKQSIDIVKKKQEQRKIEIKGSEAIHVQEMGEDEQTLRMLQYNSDNELYEWMVQEVNRGHKLKRLDIIRKAMSIGKITRLQGSSQWCDQFLARYPTLKKNLTTVDDESQKKQEQNKKSIQGQQILVSKTQFNQSILRENEQSKMDQEPKSEINQDGLKKKLNQLWSQDIYQNEIIQEQKIDLKAKWLQESYKGVDSNYYLPFERSLAIGDEQKQASSQPNIKFQKNQAESQNHDSRMAQRNQMKNEDGNEMGKEPKSKSAVNDAQQIGNDFAQMSRSHKPKRVRDVAGRYYQ